VLREIASGENGCPLAGLEAQKRAREVLAECGYTWPNHAPPPERTATVPDVPFETENEMKKAPRISKRGHSPSSYRSLSQNEDRLSRPE
jgi:hypothetical protein